MRSAAITIRRRKRARRPIQPAILLLGAIAAFMMPSFYAGGSHVAHAHAFFQFWLPGSGDPHDHHTVTHHPGAQDHAHEVVAVAPDDDASACLPSDANLLDDCPMKDTWRPSPKSADGELGASPATPAEGLAGSQQILVTRAPAVPPPESVPWQPPWSNPDGSSRVESPEPPPPRSRSFA